MKITFIFVIFIYNCSTFTAKKDPFVKDSEDHYRVCFWNVKNLSEKGLKKSGKGQMIIEFAKNCDVISFMEVRSANVDMAAAFEKGFQEHGADYICMEGDPKGKEDSTRTEKYLACVRKEFADDIEKHEFEDKNNDFARAPTFFLFSGIKKILVVPFHSTPGDRNELIQFQKVADFATRNFSDRKIFLGGDFNTGKRYQKPDFLASLTYFVYMNQLIREATTFGDQKHDLIFTDAVLAKQCKGKVWRLDEFFPEIDGRKELEKISDHFPVSAECK
ncbi:MAG TPA: hypothetical protein PL048_01440 [Leptospiraceae bacterium]|nr:hypothetical protein [Leptospiraceae bacterium]HNF14218.1 hypothetical protein [Leptospiraceae bacterium]HNI97134.1 hypothetical protein [Leptospiraceae bacterium]HNM05181.1 hypothetical protein [Leptospiraceae bacterium]HNN06652.1 hypothetical protein [Leptospiraceae bacterium]